MSKETVIIPGINYSQGTDLKKSNKCLRIGGLKRSRKKNIDGGSFSRISRFNDINSRGSPNGIPGWHFTGDGGRNDIEEWN